MNEDFLKQKLEQRKVADAFRSLKAGTGGVDFCSNDYLGIVKHQRIDPGKFQRITGSTGSRLISGNYPLIEDTEKQIAIFHDADSALIFNSGYDANTGLLGSVPQRTDTVIYDRLSHASIRDGVRLSMARSFAYEHNDLQDLEKKLQSSAGNIFVVTESVFSMDGDMAPLQAIAAVCENYNAMLIVDEAHATGVIGNRGEGLVQHLGLASKCFARVHTFGKALGAHGAVVLGSATLRDYLINFSRAFIYTTALPASAVQAIGHAYALFPSMDTERKKIAGLVEYFQEKGKGLTLCNSSTPIQGIIIPGNEKVKQTAAAQQENGFDARAILYPTVPRNLERIRIVIHSFNTPAEIDGLFATPGLFANPGNE